MATYFARSTVSLRFTPSQRLSSDCLLQLNRLPEYRRARFYAARVLLAELLFMLYGITRLPPISLNPRGRPMFADRTLPDFSISYAGNIVGVAISGDGECGLSMTLPHRSLTRTSISKLQPPFTRHETAWVQNQSNTVEAQTQLIALRRSITKLYDGQNFYPYFVELMPCAGRLRSAVALKIEALCDIEDVLVWSIAASPEIGQLQLWEFSSTDGWYAPVDISAVNTKPEDRIMSLTTFAYEKTAALH